MALRRSWPGLTLILTTLVAAATATGYNGTPPSARTGAPQMAGVAAEGMCIDCHNDYSVNQGGAVRLVNPPASYVPEANYTLTLEVASTQTASSPSRVWGFQLTAVRATDGTGAGTLASVAGQGTTVASGGGWFATRRYVEVATNDHAGASSPVRWQFQWTAPAPGAGDVTFCYSGVAANGSNGNNSDWTYRGTYTMTESTTPVRTGTWGEVKTRYLRP